MEIEKFLSERFSYLKLMKIYIKKRSGIVGRYERVWESIKNWISLFYAMFQKSTTTTSNI